MESKSKIIAISGYYGFENFGDEAILSVLVEHLKKNNADIVIFSSDPEWTISNYSVNINQSYHLY